MIFLSLGVHGGVVSIPKRSLKVSGKPSFTHINDQDIRVFVWNAYKGKKTEWYKTFHKLADLSSIFLFQEYYDSDDFDYTLSLRSQEESVLGISYEIFLWGETGVGTLSKVGSIRRRNFRAKHREDFTLATYKTSLFTWYPLTNTEHTLMVVNVHLLNSVPASQYRDELVRLKKVIEQHTGPLIVAGDFNVWQDKLKDLQQWALSLGLNEVGFNPDRRKFFEDGLAIDRIYYKGLLLKASWSEETKHSDHNPLGAQFSVLPMYLK